MVGFYAEAKQTEAKNIADCIGKGRGERDAQQDRRLQRVAEKQKTTMSTNSIQI
jgi:hypothetical protein